MSATHDNQHPLPDDSRQDHGATSGRRASYGKRLNELVVAAYKLPQTAREGFIARECEGDPAMRDAALALLRQGEMATNISKIDQSHFTPSTTPTPPTPPSPSYQDSTEAKSPSLPASLSQAHHASRIGSYTIMGVLGEGGMGMVYIAEQERPRRTVALKVMNKGVVSARNLRRFDHESQILARLHHPGIAQIFEASTADTGNGPQPFFAMEYIRGRTLLEHSFARELSVRDRLQLFLKVCDAVQHAHLMGVIHRDLKPANIMVENTGQPKVLDFGIARATDVDMQTATLATEAGQLIGTVPYMSPEQISGDPHAIDTRSDVYALGVIFYELLSGQMPLIVSDKTIPEAIRIIQQDEPRALGMVNPQLKGDLQTIAAKALEKDRTRRYQSAADLGADVQRYLDDEPILARPPSRTYQLKKFAQRNRALVAGVVAAFVALTAGSIATAWQAMRAMEGQRLAEARGLEAQLARAKAQAEADNAKSVNAFLTSMLEAANPEEGNEKDFTVVEMVDRAAAQLRVASATSVATSVDGTSSTLESLPTPVAGAVGTTPSTPLPIVAQSIDASGANPWVRVSLHNTLSTTYRALGKGAQSVEQAQLAVEGAIKLHGETSPVTMDAKRTLAMAYDMIADFEKCEQLTREVYEYHKKNRGENDVETALVKGELARVLHQQGHFEQAEPMIRESLDVLIPILGETHKAVLTNMDHLGITLLQMRRLDESIAQLRKVLALREQVFGTESAVTAFTLNNLANALQKNEQNDEAIAMLSRVVEIRRKRLPPDHPSLLVSMSNLAVTLTTAGRLTEAEPLLRASVESQIRVHGEKHPKTMVAMGNLAFVLEDLNRLSEAEVYFRRVVDLRREVSLSDPNAWPELNNLAMLLTKQGKYEEAASLYKEVVALANEHAPANYLPTAIFRNNYGECLTKLGRYEEASIELTQSMAALEAVLKPGHPRLAKAQSRLDELQRMRTAKR